MKIEEVRTGRLRIPLSQPIASAIDVGFIVGRFFANGTGAGLYAHSVSRYKSVREKK
jgi:hypothetical protein